MEATGVYWKPIWHILSDGEFELVLANRRVLRVGTGFDAATLRRLLPLLEEDGPC